MTAAEISSSHNTECRIQYPNPILGSTILTAFLAAAATPATTYVVVEIEGEGDDGDMPVWQ
jgi:hypothetical protein